MRRACVRPWRCTRGCRRRWRCGSWSTLVDRDLRDHGQQVEVVRPGLLDERLCLAFAPAEVHGLLDPGVGFRSEEHTSELQSLMRFSYAVFCLKKKRHQRSSQMNTS